MEEVKHLYRYDYNLTSGFLDLTRVELPCYKFDIIRETPCGYWIVDHEEEGKFTMGRLMGKEKWVSKTATKRWAHDTEDKALTNFIYRKKYQLRMLEDQVGNVKYTLKLAEQLKEKVL